LRLRALLTIFSVPVSPAAKVPVPLNSRLFNGIGGRPRRTGVRGFRKLDRFWRMDGAERAILAEATFCLALARFALLVVPFKRIVPWLERAPDTQSCSTERNAAAIAAVRQAIVMAARNVPWNAVCLPQAMAGKAMLARRGQGSALHIGAALPDRGTAMAHAWLVAGGEIVIGEDDAGDVTPLVRFG
jgi:hypothetical protein